MNRRHVPPLFRDRRRASPVLATTLFALAALAGCRGSLRVQVDVLDPRVVERESSRRLVANDLPAVLSSTDESIRKTWDAIRDAHWGAVKKASGVVDAEWKRMRNEGKPLDYRALAAQLFRDDRLQREFLAAPSLAGSGPKAAFQDGFGTVRARYNDSIATLVGGANEIRAEYARALATGIDPCEDPGCRLVHLLRTRRAELDATRDWVVGEIDRLSANLAGLAGAEPFDAAFRDVLSRNRWRLEATTALEERSGALAGLAVVKSEFARQRSIIGGQGLVESPVAFSVASAPEEAWATRFSHAYGGGTNGDTDIAIKMDSLGEFTVKGLRFDPEDVARAASKVGTQAVVLGAQIAGVPIAGLPKGSEGKDGAALATSSGQLVSLQEALAKGEARRADVTAALWALGRAIAAERANLDSPDAEIRGVAIQAIKAAVTAMGVRLTLK